MTVLAPLASAQPRPAESHRDGAHMQQPGPQARPSAQRDAHHPAAKPGHAQSDRGHRGAGPDHNLNRGAKLPAHYRTKHYVVDDWRGHGLQRPARGQHWVQLGSDYLLVAAATGVIAQVITH
ncbi:MAG: RcnB family protein [Comamonas sp.]